MTTSDNKGQQMTTGDAMNDKEWYSFSANNMVLTWVSQKRKGNFEQVQHYFQTILMLSSNITFSFSNIIILLRAFFTSLKLLLTHTEAKLKLEAAHTKT